MNTQFTSDQVSLNETIKANKYKTKIRSFISDVSKQNPIYLVN